MIYLHLVIDLLNHFILRVIKTLIFGCKVKVRKLPICYKLRMKRGSKRILFVYFFSTLIYYAYICKTNLLL